MEEEEDEQGQQGEPGEEAGGDGGRSQDSEVRSQKSEWTGLRISVKDHSFVPGHAATRSF
jgi:hypothetical protein